MKLLLIADSYPPEICAVATLMNELAISFAKDGNEVFVLTTKPHSRIIQGSNKSFETISEEEGITVIRVSTPPTHTKSLVKRGINTILMPYVMYSKIPEQFRNIAYDAVISYSPPLNLGLVARKIASLSRSPYLLILRDIFPQNAIDLGILRNRLMIRFFEHIENKVYNAADLIFAQSHENKDFLVRKKKLPEEKIEVLYNWIDTTRYQHESIFDFRKEFSLNGKKICLFAGTMGPSQGLERVLSVAHLFRDDNLLFLFVGNGREKKNLEILADEMKLNNVAFLDYVEQTVYPSLLNSVQIGLISLSESNHTPIVPGKLMGYMAGRIPVLAFLNKESTDTMRILDESGAGKYVTDGNVELFAEYLREFIRDERLLASMGSKGRRFVEENFSVDSAMKEIEKAIISCKESRQ